MNQSKIKTNTSKKSSGIFVKGRVISSTATTYDRKDGTGKGVILKHELALVPGFAMIEEFLNPADHPEIELRGSEVVKFPQFDEFQEVHLKVLKFDVYNDILRIRKSELVSIG